MDLNYDNLSEEMKKIIDENKIILGIDLGTTYSCASVMLDDHVIIMENSLGLRTTPSYVCFFEHDKICVGELAKSNAFIISVKDNGKGIKDEDKGQIFLPNFTTKTGGSGVGLSLTYNIVQAAGGSISFESQEGEGAEFIIELPKKQDQPNI